MRIRRSNFLTLTAFLWLIVIGGFTWWNTTQIRSFHLHENLRTARSFFNIILTTRSWNAQHGGVYVPITEDIQPNPYLDSTDRDITTTEGENLTKINPAYMTRLIAELAEKNDLVLFHITSSNPIRPENQARPWEQEALYLFETDSQTEYYRWDKNDEIFYYMAPLITDESCLQCHAQQGYQVGDIRGGISVTFSAKAPQLWPTITGYSIVGIIGVVFITTLGSKLITSFQELELKSETDGLTKLHNQRFFKNYYQKEFANAKRTKKPLSAIICDIDFFKSYNDTYGHIKGDQCLQEVAQAIKRISNRPGDLVCRYGGEEFVILLPYTDIEGCRLIAGKVRETIEDLKIPHTNSLISECITISLGGSTYYGQDISEEEFFEKVDNAMYQAKQAGRNTVVIAK